MIDLYQLERWWYTSWNGGGLSLGKRFIVKKLTIVKHICEVSNGSRPCI